MERLDNSFSKKVFIEAIEPKASVLAVLLILIFISVVRISPFFLSGEMATPSYILNASIYAPILW